MEGDVDALLSTLRLMHEENGIFSLSEPKLRSWIDSSFQPDSTVIIGVIGEPGGEIEATIAMSVFQLYYTEDWHLGDMWNFVCPKFRDRDHISQLISYAKSVSEQAGIPLISGVATKERTEAKVELFRRQMGPLFGAIFLYEPKGLS